MNVRLFLCVCITASWFSMLVLSESRPTVAQEPATAAGLPAMTLIPSGLPASTVPEANLPVGAILHVRINSSQALLDDLSKMATPFIPERAVGPPAIMALEQPNPLLALVGLQTTGQPMSVEMLSGLSGIDPARPITLTFYLDDPAKSFVLWLPVLDLDRPAALLQNLLQPSGAPKKTELDGGFAQHINAQNLDFFVVCGNDAIGVCGSQQLAQALITDQPNQKLRQSTFLANAIETHAADNLLIAIDLQPIKSMLPVLEQFHFLPPEVIDDAKGKILEGIGESELQPLNKQLQSRLGVRDVEQLMDYVECIGLGAYEVTFEGLMGAAKDFRGLTIAVDLAEEFQSLEFAVFSDSIFAAKSMKPFPMEPVKKVVGNLPGEHDYLIVSGRSTEPQKSAYLGAILERIGKKMIAKRLPMMLHQTATQGYENYTPVVPLESMVDWSIGTRFFVANEKPEAYDDAWTYLTVALQNFAWIYLQAIPPQDEKFVENHFAQKSKMMNANYANWRALWRDARFAESWIRQSSGSQVADLDGGVKQLTSEDRYTTSSGLFGYNEHELINRYFTLYKNNVDHILLWPGGNSAERFLAFKPQPTAPAIDRLLAAAASEPNLQQIEIWRNIQTVVRMVDTANGIESLLHKELTNYLAEVNKILAAVEGNDDELVAELVAALETIPMPISVAHVHLDPRSKEVILVTPLGITFPRPRIVPAVVELLRDYQDVSDTVGGAMVTHSTRDGEYTIVVSQSTAAMSGLIRTVGNNFADAYLSGPAGQQKLQSLLVTERDQFLDDTRRLITNTNWLFLD